MKLSKGNYACERVGDIGYYVFEDRSRVCFVSNVFPETMETQVVRVQLDGTLQFQSIPPLLPAYNKYISGVDRLSQVRKTYGFDRKLKQYWIRPFFKLFDYAINNAYLFYKLNRKLFDMPPKELLNFRAALVNLIRRSRYKKRPVVPRSSSHSRDGVPTGSLCRVGEVGISKG